MTRHAGCILEVTRQAGGPTLFGAVASTLAFGHGDAAFVLIFNADAFDTEDIMIASFVE